MVLQLIKNKLIRFIQYEVRLQISEKEKIPKFKSCGSGVVIKNPVTTYASDKIEIGNSVCIGEYSVLRGNGGLIIGDETMIAANVSIITRGHPTDLPRRDSSLSPYIIDKKVIIRKNVWIGVGAIILPGVTIGEGAMVAAGSVVCKDVEPKSLVGGVPAKFIRYLIENNQEKRKDL